MSMTFVWLFAAAPDDECAAAGKAIREGLTRAQTPESKSARKVWENDRKRVLRDAQLQIDLMTAFAPFDVNEGAMDGFIDMSERLVDNIQGIKIPPAMALYLGLGASADELPGSFGNIALSSNEVAKLAPSVTALFRKVEWKRFWTTVSQLLRGTPGDDEAFGRRLLEVLPNAMGVAAQNGLGLVAFATYT